ncbi:Protein fantom [Lobulomyces angularis]|nr:Protein fantom [Lobulomyces angularis]
MNSSRNRGGLLGIGNHHVGKISADEDALYTLKDDNLNLKKKLNSQDDKTKKLLTKVQRLSEDLRKAQSTSVKDSTKGVSSKKEEIENEYAITDLKSKMHEISKQNNQLRNKVQYFKSLHEAEVRKRAPYDHIPPRIHTGVQRKIYPGVNLKKKGKVENSYVEVEETDTALNEDIQKLEDLVYVLRGKLIEVEQELEETKTALGSVQEENTNVQKRQDIDRLGLQRDLVEKNKKIQNLTRDNDMLEEKYKAISETHQDALMTVENLTLELKEERQRVLDLDSQLRDFENEREKNFELMEMLKDIKAEKDLLENEYNNLLNNQFSKEREKEFRIELEKLKSENISLEREIQQYINEKATMLNKLKDMTENLKQCQNDKEFCEKRMLELQSQLEALQDKVRHLTLDGEIDLNELDEALAVVRLRRQKGVPLEFLIQVDELIDDKKLLQELRLQHAECIQELEKTHKLLMLQERINKDYKGEVEVLNKKLEAMRNEYELKLEENSRLLDLRSNKIAHLEAQLREILYSTVKVPSEAVDANKDEEEIELEHGQNLMEIHIEGALISSEGLSMIKKLGFEVIESGSNSKNFTTFIHFDFFEFETQITPLGIGSKPHFNHTSRYKVFVDDFFLQYLQSQKMTFEICRSNGLEYYTFGTSNICFKDLVDSDTKTKWLQYYADIYDINDSKTIIGKVDFSLRMRIPMAQAICAFKERVVALNLLSVGDNNQKTDISKKFGNRAKVNELIVHVKQCQGLIPPLSNLPAVYCSYELYQYENIISDTVKGTTSPNFNFMKILQVPMTTDLDRYLRTSHVYILILDDNDVDNKDYMYGVAKVPLVSLVFNQKVDSIFELQDEYGFKRGSISVSIEWSEPYKLDVNPITRQIEDIQEKTKDGSTLKKFNTILEKKDANKYSSSEIMRQVVMKHNNGINLRDTEGGHKNNPQELAATLDSKNFHDTLFNKSTAKNRYVVSDKILEDNIAEKSNKRMGSTGEVDNEFEENLNLKSSNISVDSMNSHKNSGPGGKYVNTGSDEKYKQSGSSLNSSQLSLKEKKNKSISKKLLTSLHNAENDYHSRSSSCSSSQTPSSQTPSSRQSKKIYNPQINVKNLRSFSNIDMKNSEDGNISQNDESHPSYDVISRSNSVESSSHSLKYGHAKSSLSSTTSEVLQTETLYAKRKKKNSKSSTNSEKSLKQSLSDDSLKNKHGQYDARNFHDAHEFLQVKSSTSENDVREPHEHPFSNSDSASHSSFENEKKSNSDLLEANDGNSNFDSYQNLPLETNLQSSNFGCDSEQNERSDISSQEIDRFQYLKDKTSEYSDDLNAHNSQWSRSNSNEKIFLENDNKSQITNTSENSECQSQSKDFLKIIVDNLKFDVKNLKVREILSSVKQVFVVYDFLEIPSNELESKSIILNNNGILNLEFEKKFLLNAKKDKFQRNKLREMIFSSDPGDNLIVFTVVSEPEQIEREEEVGDCMDIAVAELHLPDLLEHVGNEALLNLPIWNVDGEILLGTLEVKIEGCDVIREIINDF